ncbi:MAG: hypothetical protein U1F46_12600 [Marinagarivorans sp.]
MARLGIKKTFAAGNFGDGAILDWFNQMKSTLLNAGFVLRLETADTFDVIQAGAAAGPARDDVAHWAFRYENQGADGAILVYTVFGNHIEDPGAITRSHYIVHSGFVGTPAPEVTLWFAADGATGGWWIHGLQPDASSSTGVTHRIAFAGTTARRYAADTFEGLCARYGVWDPTGSWKPAYARNFDGSLNVFASTMTWSPFGEGWAYSGRRHPGSPLPKMAVPMFPSRANGVTACILGELNDIMVLTNGYASEETVMPGWIAMIGDDFAQPYAVPAPDAFTLL